MIYAVFENTNEQTMLVNPDKVETISELKNQRVCIIICDTYEDDTGYWVKGTLLEVTAELTRAHEARHGISDKTSSQWLQQKLSEATP